MTEKSLVERMIELGLGVASYGEEKVSEFLKDMGERGEGKRKEVHEMKKELKEKAAAFQKEFGKRVRKEVEIAMDKMHLATTDELDALRKRVEELEKKIAQK